MSQPLMPKATAVWLVDNTSLTFEQIAEFCELHTLEVKGIADGEVAQGIKGLDPVASGQLTRQEIERCQQNSTARLMIAKPKHEVPEVKPRKGPRYTPVSRRQDRPDAIAWLVRYHPELTDAQVSRLVGTTKPTIQAVRDRTHWNSASITPVDPVTLGLCTQIELDAAVAKAAKKSGKSESEQEAPSVATLIPASESIKDEEPAQKDAFSSGSSPSEDAPAADPEYDADSVFARLKDLKPEEDEDETA